MIIEFLDEARQELIEAALWYEGKQPGLGKRFRNEIAFIVERIAETPLLWHERVAVIVESIVLFSPTIYLTLFVEKKLSSQLSPMRTANPIFGNLGSPPKLEFPITTVHWKEGSSLYSSHSTVPSDTTSGINGKVIEHPNDGLPLASPAYVLGRYARRVRNLEVS